VNTDAALLFGLGFVAGYAVRAWMSARRRRAIRKSRRIWVSSYPPV